VDVAARARLQGAAAWVRQRPVRPSRGWSGRARPRGGGAGNEEGRKEVDAAVEQGEAAAAGRGGREKITLLYTM
jgi:hypothetical protein